MVHRLTSHAIPRPTLLTRLKTEKITRRKWRTTVTTSVGTATSKLCRLVVLHGQKDFSYKGHKGKLKLIHLLQWSFSQLPALEDGATPTDQHCHGQLCGWSLSSWINTALHMLFTKIISLKRGICFLHTSLLLPTHHDQQRVFRLKQLISWFWTCSSYKTTYFFPASPRLNIQVTVQCNTK